MRAGGACGNHADAALRAAAPRGKCGVGSTAPVSCGRGQAPAAAERPVLGVAWRAMRGSGRSGEDAGPVRAPACERALRRARVAPGRLAQAGARRDDRTAPAARRARPRSLSLTATLAFAAIPG